MILRFTIPGDPIAWQRARINKKKFFDPQKKDKLSIQILFKSTFPGFQPITKPIFLTAQFRFPMPQSLTKKKRVMTLYSPVTKVPDLSNLIKFYEDALNGHMWIDDRIIYKEEITKTYSLIAETILEVQTYG